MNGILQVTLDSIKKNGKPGLVLWLLALSLVLVYYYIPSSTIYFDIFGNLKNQYGILYSIVSTAIFGGLVPFLYLYFSKQITKNLLAEFVFIIFFWAEKGLEVDILYSFQGVLFGNEPTLATIIKKTAADQFIYSALWAAPSIALAYRWKENNFSLRSMKKNWSKKVFTLDIPTMIISNWIVWIPAVAIIYSLPMSLQIPMFNLVLCFWVLLVAFLSKNATKN